MAPKQESELLMNEMLPVAEKMLSHYGEFHPYGGYMKHDGEIVHVGARVPETEHPKAQDLIRILLNTFRDLAVRDQCKAVAVVYNVVVPLPTAPETSDAIQVCVDHVGGYSAEVFFPYQMTENGLIIGQAFAQEGKSEIFNK